MKARTWPWLILVSLCLTMIACGSTGPTILEEQGITDNQKTVNTMTTLHRSLRVPIHLLETGGIKTGGEFDANEYLTVLDHLSMEPGYVLDYVYKITMLEGSPILYARKADETPYRTFDEYRETMGQIVWTSYSCRAPQLEHMYRYMDHIQVDDTPEGFFQFVLLRIMGGQFYLYWHADYNDCTVVCDRTGIEAVLGSGQQYVVPNDVRQTALALEAEPTIEMGDDTVMVRVIVFTKWGGFMQRTYTISREFPHRVLEEEERVLVEYDCGIVM